jgi:type IV pilus assembly protein PilV
MSMTSRRCGKSPRRQVAGVSLVEALVALLVLSIGMLGIAGLFVESVRSSRSALLRTQAVNLVSDMAERIRANATARDAYVLATGDAPEAGTCAAVAGDDGTNCTPDELAADDLARWVAAVRAALPPNGAEPALTEIVYDEPAAPGAPERYVIRVAWSEPGSGAPLEYRNDVTIIPRGPA